MPIDMSAAKAPPRKRATAGTASARIQSQPVETRTPNERRYEGLNGLAQLGQGLCLLVGQYADAAAIGQHFDPVARELANIADSSDFVAKPVDFLIEIGPYGALIAAVMPLALQIMANHKIIDATKLAGQGIVPPELLEAQMKTQVARMQAQAMKAQQEAMAETKRLQEEYDKLAQSNFRPEAA